MFSEEEAGLETLLVFITGYDTVPPLGFEPSLRLNFVHPETQCSYDGVPYANTCANMLTIPVLEEYETFKQRMNLALKIGTVFTNA